MNIIQHVQWFRHDHMQKGPWIKVWVNIGWTKITSTDPNQNLEAKNLWSLAESFLDIFSNLFS